MRFQFRFMQTFVPFGMMAVSTMAVPAMANAQTLQGAALVSALQHGGYIIVMRHPSSPMTPPAKNRLNPDNVKGERQLDAQGIASATAMGQAFRAMKLPIGEVLSSPTYRALQAVKYAQLGTAKTVPELGEAAGGMQMQTGGSQSEAQYLQDSIKKLPTGTDTIMITHFPNLRSAFPDIAANVADGEALIFGPDGKGGTALVARVKIDEWPALAKQ